LIDIPFFTTTQAPISAEKRTKDITLENNNYIISVNGNIDITIQKDQNENPSTSE